MFEPELINDIFNLAANPLAMAYIVYWVNSQVISKLCAMRTRMAPVTLPLWSRVLLHGTSAFGLFTLLCYSESLIGSYDRLKVIHVCRLCYFWLLAANLIEKFSCTTTNKKLLNSTYAHPLIVAIEIQNSLDGSIRDLRNLQRISIRYSLLDSLFIHCIELFNARDKLFFCSVISELTKIASYCEIVVGPDYDSSINFGYNTRGTFEILLSTLVFIATYLPYLVAKVVRYSPFEKDEGINNQRNPDKLKYFYFFDNLKVALDFSTEQTVTQVMETFLGRIGGLLLNKEESVENSIGGVNVPESLHHSYLISGYLNMVKGTPEDIAEQNPMSEESMKWKKMSLFDQFLYYLPMTGPLFAPNLKFVVGCISLLARKTFHFVKPKKNTIKLETDNQTHIPKNDFNDYITENNYYKFLTKPDPSTMSMPNKNVDNILPLLLPEEDNSKDYIPSGDNSDAEEEIDEIEEARDLKKEVIELITPFKEDSETLDGMTWNTSVWSRFKYRNDLNSPLTRNKYSELNPDGILTEAFVERIGKSESQNKMTIQFDSEIDLSCVICKDNTRNIVLWPCRCLAICDGCRYAMGSRGFKKCCCCNTEIEAYSKLNIV
ncbi:ERAD-associated E3 ubiquitin-protein ligase ASI1 [Nakaseomyces bracarensis]|uniref:ERAD-associated E3 ubiquitin-protein ligase ASI1 n=1 Tax=Nakaseomyces bracarensis TaxID=273131 RepID=A0ABR4NVG1_9SACH